MNIPDPQHCTSSLLHFWVRTSVPVWSDTVSEPTYTADAVHLHSELSSQYGVLTSDLKKRRKITLNEPLFLIVWGGYFFYAVKTHNRGFRGVFRGDKDFYDPQIVLIHRIRNTVVLKEKSKWRNKIHKNHWKTFFTVSIKKNDSVFSAYEQWNDLPGQTWWRFLRLSRGMATAQPAIPASPPVKESANKSPSINHIYVL